MWGMAEWSGFNDDIIDKSLDRAVELGCNFLTLLEFIVREKVNKY